MSRIIENPGPQITISDNGDGELGDDDQVDIPDPKGGAPAHMKVSTYLGIEPTPGAVHLLKDIARKQGLNCDRFSKLHPLK